MLVVAEALTDFSCTNVVGCNHAALRMLAEPTRHLKSHSFLAEHVGGLYAGLRGASRKAPLRHQAFRQASRQLGDMLQHRCG